MQRICNKVSMSKTQTQNMKWLMVNGRHLYSAVQLMLFIHTFTHTHTPMAMAAMQGTNQLIRSNWGLGVLLKDTLTWAE